jgi:hypothetical protein
VAGKRLEHFTLAHALAFEGWRDLSHSTNVALTQEDIAALYALLCVDGLQVGAALETFARVAGKATKHFFAVATSDEIQALLQWWLDASATALRVEGASAVGQKIEGLGWVLEVAHSVAAAYSCSPEHVIYEIPLPRVFAYVAAIHKAAGGKFAAADYVGRDVTGEMPAPGVEPDMPGAEDAPAETEDAE